MDCIGVIFKVSINSQARDECKSIIKHILSCESVPGSTIKLISALIKPLSDLSVDSLKNLSNWELPKLLSSLYNGWSGNVMWITGLLQVCSA